MSGINSKAKSKNDALQNVIEISNAQDQDPIITGLSVPNNDQEVSDIYAANAEVSTKKLVSSSVIETYFPGFMSKPQNGFIASSTCYKILADENWKGGDSIQFRINPSNPPHAVSNGFNPSLVMLTLTGKFTENDGTALVATSNPASGWPGLYFEDVVEKTLDTGMSFSPTENPPSRHYFKKIHYNTPKANLELLDVLQYDNSTDIIGRRNLEADNAEANTAQKARANKNTQWKAEREYNIPLKLLAPSFRRNTLDFDGLELTLKIQKDSVKYMESIKKDGALTDKPGKFVITKQPYIMVSMYQMSAAGQNYFNNMYNSTGKYSYGSIENFTLYGAQMTAGTTQQQFNFPALYKKFKFVEIGLSTVESQEHNSIYDTYDEEFATTHIKKIDIQRAKSAMLENPHIRYDFDDSIDKYRLYNQFLGYMTDSCTDQNRIDMIGYNAASNFPSFEKYFSSGHRIFIDLTDSKNYTDMEDPVTNNHDGMSVTVYLKEAVKAGSTYYVSLYGINSATYMRGRTNNGNQLQLIEETLSNQPYFVQPTTDPITIRPPSQQINQGY